MLSASFLGRPERLRHYFLRAEREPGAEGPAGLWWGRGARVLGLEGEDVRPRPFLELLRGRVPGACPPHGTVARSRRIGLDFTFSAPKSVSVAALVEGDRRWIAWHEEAVDRVLRAVETRHLFACTERVGTPLGLLVARFRHGLSRSGDPQLHTHTLLLSRVPCTDGAWRPFDPWPLLRLQKILGQRYRHHLAFRARSLGWGLRPRGLAFECDRYPESLLTAWSRRARAIEADLARAGLERATASARRKACVALRTRGPKPSPAARDLRERWRREAREHDPGWSGRRPSSDHACPTPSGRDLLGEACAAGAILGRTSVVLSTRGLVFREVEIRHAVYREALGRGGESGLEHAWRLARRAGLFLRGTEPAGFRTPRTGWDRWYRPKGVERWLARVAALGPFAAPRGVEGGAPRSRALADVEAGYDGLLRRLVTARDLGRAPEANERGVRLAARTRLHGRELLVAAGLEPFLGPRPPGPSPEARVNKAGPARRGGAEASWGSRLPRAWEHAR